MKKVNLAAGAANDAKFAIEFPELAKLGITKEENEAFMELVNNLNVGSNLRAKAFITGTVVQKTKEGLYISHGTKHDAFCAAAEAGDLNVGDTASFWVLDPAEYEKAAQVSHLKSLGWKHLEELKESSAVVSARVFFIAKEKRTQRVAGLRVVFEEGVLKGIRGFIPYKETQNRRNIETLLNQTLECVVIKADPHRGPFGDLVLSNTAVATAQTRDLVAQLEAGLIVEGKVKKILNLEDNEKGVLVELCDGLTGIMYSRDMTSIPGKAVTDLIKVGDVRNFEVKRVDTKENKVWLATRRLDKLEFQKQIAKDQTYTGKVVRAYEYGVFVHIGCEINGLVHVSELKKNGYVDNNEVKVGDMVSVKVRNTDEKCERIGLQLLGRI